MAKFGLLLTSFDKGTTPQLVARIAEEEGFDSFYLPENSHVPLKRPGTRKKFENIRRLANFYDPYISLAACAALTKCIVLGTSVSLLTQREPIVTANVIASLDRIANGRLVVGVAGGFIREAMENFGSSFVKRWQIVRERTMTMRSIWKGSEGIAPFTTSNKSCCRQSIPPYQKGGPPIRIGSNSKYVPSRVADYADGWITSYGAYDGDPIADLKYACASVNRDFSTVSTTMMNPPDSFAELKKLVSDGYDEIVWPVSQVGNLSVTERLKQLAYLAARLRRVS